MLEIQAMPLSPKVVEEIYMSKKAAKTSKGE